MLRGAPFERRDHGKQEKSQFRQEPRVRSSRVVACSEGKVWDVDEREKYKREKKK